MKNLITYIKEAYQKKEIENLKVVFDVLPEDFYINAPETYSESDIQIYIGDRLLPELPTENSKYSKLLGKNIDNINDVYFEYEKFEHIQDSDSIDEFNIEWDSYYDSKNNKDTKLDVFKLHNLKYIILFDTFEIFDDSVESDDYEKLVDDIFKNLNSSNINKYPVEIQYNHSEFNE